MPLKTQHNCFLVVITFNRQSCFDVVSGIVHFDDALVCARVVDQEAGDLRKREANMLLNIDTHTVYRSTMQPPQRKFRAEVQIYTNMLSLLCDHGKHNRTHSRRTFGVLEIKMYLALNSNVAL